MSAGHVRRFKLHSIDVRQENTDSPDVGSYILWICLSSIEGVSLGCRVLLMGPQVNHYNLDTLAVVGFEPSHQNY